MPTRDDNSAETLSDREFANSRVFDAPPERVFKAWTDPNHLGQWWGPKGFTNTFEEFDIRPGGHWRFVMHGPDGTNHKNHSIFVEVVEPERIVFNHISGPKFQVTAACAEQAGKTELTFRMLFESVAECERIKVFAFEVNEQNFDRLAAQLERMG